MDVSKKAIETDRVFVKHYRKRIANNPKLVNRFNARVRAFAMGERGTPLNDHGLVGKKLGLRAFAITGDIRVVYAETDAAYVFLDIGSHSQVY